MEVFIVDAGHGMSNRRAGVFDPGAVSNGVRECDIAMDWTNELRTHILAAGRKVIRTRVDHRDPAPVGQRANIARQYKGEIMVSFHCNAATGSASGTETFYRGVENRPLAVRLNAAIVTALGSRNRGAKTEAASQHARLAIMSFQPCFLIEIGFIDNASDRAKMLNPELRTRACKALAEILLSL